MTKTYDWLKQAERKLRAGAIRQLRIRRAMARRQRHPGTFIGVTGSSTKSTTVTLLAHVLAGLGPTRLQSLQNTINPILHTMASLQPDEIYSVHELGAGHSHFREAAQVISPDLVIVTMIGLEHRSMFKTKENVAREKGQLVEALRPGGVAVLNGDDPIALSMAEKTQERHVTFGQGEGVTYRATQIHAAFPERLRLRITWPGGTLDLQTQFAGAHFWLPVTAAVAAALELGVPPEMIAQRIARVPTVAGRCEPMDIPGGPTFLLDTAKAPAETLPLALDMLREARAPRKRFVLYAVSDFKGSNRKQFSSIYKLAREAADEVIFVGDRAKHATPSEEDLAQGRFRAFPDVASVTQYLKETAQTGEVILLKSSSGYHLERIALAFRREVRCWEEKCGLALDCDGCPALEAGYSRETMRKRKRLDLRPYKKRDSGAYVRLLPGDLPVPGQDAPRWTGRG